MKRTTRIGLLLLILLPTWAARAQSPVTTLERLDIALWPDYDRPSVLVSLTGELGSDIPLPAIVTVPFPADAQLNAVARIDERDRMLADIAYSTDAGALTLTTPSPLFHVEYYVPYRVESGEHAITLTWLSGLSVEQLQAVVQRPAAAASLLSEPMAAEILTGKDGLMYHRLAPQAVPAGQPFSVWVRYPMASTRLSADPQDSSPPAAAPAAPASPSLASESDFSWLIVATAAAVGLVCAFLARRVSKSRSEAAPRGVAGTSGVGAGAARFCHACGRPARGEDRFCSGCGVELVA